MRAGQTGGTRGVAIDQQGGGPPAAAAVSMGTAKPMPILTRLFRSKATALRRDDAAAAGSVVTDRAGVIGGGMAHPGTDTENKNALASTRISVIRTGKEAESIQGTVAAKFIPWKTTMVVATKET